MSDRPRYVVDTNVLVSALLFEQSTPGSAFRRVLDSGELLLSSEVVAELQDVLSRKKFERYLSSDDREAFLTALVVRSTFVEPTEIIPACRDPKDDMLLALAISGGASAILTGDADLLVLGSFRNIPILSSGEFLLRQSEHP